MKQLLISIICFVSFLILLWLGCSTGSFETGPKDIWNALFHYDESNLMHFSIINLRLPRVLLAFLVGAALSVSGYLMQLSINNPLADPYILGTSSAASLGANLVFFGAIPISIMGFYMPQVMAFIVAILCTFVVISIARRKAGVSGSKMLLAGIAMSSLLTSIIAILAFLADSNEKLRTIIFWVMGSFEQAKWNDILIMSVVLIVISAVSIPLSKHLNLLILGTEKAKNLGLKSNIYYNGVIISAVFLASISVSIAGAIGFVGLMIPHVVRALFGVTSRYNIIFCILIGGAFMMFSDWMSKFIYPPVGLPIGIITSLFGVPFFVYLLSKRNYNFE